FAYSPICPPQINTCLDFITLTDSGSDEKAAVAHDLFFAGIRFKPDVEAQADHIDVCAGCPGSAGVLSVRISESDVNAWKFLVLQDIADHALDADVSSNGKLAQRQQAISAIATQA